MCLFFPPPPYASSVMRTQGSLRLILNTKLWAQMQVDKASEKSVRITAMDTEDQGVKVFLISVCWACVCRLLFQKERLKDMHMCRIKQQEMSALHECWALSNPQSLLVVCWASVGLVPWRQTLSVYTQNNAGTDFLVCFLDLPFRERQLVRNYQTFPKLKTQDWK